MSLSIRTMQFLQNNYSVMVTISAPLYCDWKKCSKYGMGNYLHVKSMPALLSNMGQAHKDIKPINYIG